MAIKRFKPKNIEDYIELKPGIYARKDRTKDVVKLTKKNTYYTSTLKEGKK